MIISTRWPPNVISCFPKSINYSYNYKVAPNTPNTRGGTWLIKWWNDEFPSLVAIIYIQWIGAIMNNYVVLIDINPTGIGVMFTNWTLSFGGPTLVLMSDPLKNRWSIVAVSSHGWWFFQAPKTVLVPPFHYILLSVTIPPYWLVCSGFTPHVYPFLVFQSIIFEPLHTCQGLTPWSYRLTRESAPCKMRPPFEAAKLTFASLASLWFVWDIPSGKLT